MKKLIAISVVFALVAGAAFADISVGANVASGVTLAKSSGVKDADVETGVGRHTARIAADGENDDGTFGGHVFVFAEKDAYWNQFWWGTDAFAYAWWKPIDQVKVQMGHNPWGDWDRKQIVDWGFHASDAPDIGMHNSYGTGDNDLNQGTGFYGGFGSFGALLSLLPVEGLAINVGLPYDNVIAEKTYLSFHGQVTYNIDGTGEAAISYVSGRGWKKASDDGKKPEVDEDTGKLFASFYLTAIENMGVNIGVAFTLPKVKGEGDAAVKTSNPLEAGVGFSYNLTDAFTLKARVASTFAGNKSSGSVTIHDPLKLGFTILPSYDLEVLKFFFMAGIMYTGESEGVNSEGKIEKVKDSSAFGWHINPYITKSVGSGTFYAGIHVESDGVKGSKKAGGDDKSSAVSWSIPLGIVFGF